MSPPASDPPARDDALAVARLRDCARAAGDWLWELDASLRFSWVSDGYEAATGEPARACIGRVIDDAPLLDAAGCPLPDGRTLHRVFAAGAPVSRLLIARGTARHVALSAVPVCDAAGRCIGWRGSARDVTDAVLAEREAQAREAQLQRLAAQLPGVLHQFTVDAQGRIHFPYASDGLAALFGLQPQEVAAQSARVYEVLHPDDRRPLRQAIEQATRHAQPLHMEYRIQTSANGERWVATRALPERLPDGSTLWHGYSDDITERKRTQLALAASQARWQQAADAAGIGVVRIDRAAGEVQFDDCAAALHPGAAPRMTLADWAATMHDEDRDGVLAALDRAAHGERLWARYRWRDGAAWRWLETTASLPAGSGTLLGICRDVTVQHEAERLKREKDAAEHAARAQGELLSRLSHELRTPLNGIQGFAQLMALDQAEPLGPTQQRRLDNVRRAGKRLLQLVDGVLELTRLEQGEVVLQPRSVDLMRLLRNCLDLVRPLALNVGAVLPPVLPLEPLVVRGDARAIEQVLLNLLANAIQYNRAGGAVGVEFDTATRGRVAVVISDEGPGLTAAEQQQLFVPLRSLRGRGRGLGLAIARRLVAAMDGEIGVASVPGQGSRFRVELPAGDAAALDDSAPGTLHTPLSTPAALDGADSAAPRRVLYIEDEPLNVLLMEEVFRGQAGWRLEVARDGARGIARAREAPPDLLLVDMNLPDMGGLDVVAALRAQAATAQLLCIALSADALPEQIAAARAGGFDDYWTKPIDVARLLAALARAIERRDGGSTA
jgi:PAS domain S-box-containing protein